MERCVRLVTDLPLLVVNVRSDYNSNIRGMSSRSSHFLRYNCFHKSIREVFVLFVNASDTIFTSERCCSHY